MRRRIEKQREDVINFIRTHYPCTITEIIKSTKINVGRVFGNISEAYKSAGMQHINMRSHENIKKRYSIVNYAKKTL